MTADQITMVVTGGVTFALLMAAGLLLLAGKCWWLAGNLLTMPKETREKLDIKRICKFYGVACIILSVIIGAPIAAMAFFVENETAIIILSVILCVLSIAAAIALIAIVRKKQLFKIKD